MKKIVNSLFTLVIAAVALTSCKKDENQVTFLGGTAPVLSASKAGPLLLLLANKDSVALTFNWTNPEYRFNTGVSSQDVYYKLQFDTTGSNFTNPNMVEVGISKDLSTTLTVGQLNGYMASLLMQAYVPHNIEIRIKATLVNGTVPIYSNVLKMVVTPYLVFVVTPPGTATLGYSDGALYLVGSATNGGWNNPVPVPSQQFTKIDAGHYTITVPLIGGQQYLFLPVNGSWNAKYGAACGSDGCNNSAGDSFIAGGNNFGGPAASKTYTISVNFISGKFTVQ
jgi:starch-binding outer membrane protein SusE/F